MNTLKPKEGADPQRVSDFHRNAFDLWMSTANETQKSGMVKLFKEKYHTFGEIDAAIRSGEYAWLYVNPATGKLSL